MPAQPLYRLPLRPCTSTTGSGWVALGWQPSTFTPGGDCAGSWPVSTNAASLAYICGSDATGYVLVAAAGAIPTVTPAATVRASSLIRIAGLLRLGRQAGRHAGASP